jgi:hypothetical protein
MACDRVPSKAPWQENEIRPVSRPRNSMRTLSLPAPERPNSTPKEVHRTETTRFGFLPLRAGFEKGFFVEGFSAGARLVMIFRRKKQTWGIQKNSEKVRAVLPGGFEFDSIK